MRAPALAAALQTDVPIVALHLTRPALVIPDRAALGMPSHMEAANGAYVIHDYDLVRPKEGTVIIEGTATMDSIMELLPSFLSGDAPNLKLVCAVSYELFARKPKAYRDKVLNKLDWLDSTVITNGARRLMYDWMPHKVAGEYALSSDQDNRWRTGGSVEEVKVEAGIDPESIWKGIARFAADRDKRLGALSFQA